MLVKCSWCCLWIQISFCMWQNIAAQIKYSKFFVNLNSTVFYFSKLYSLKITNQDYIYCWQFFFFFFNFTHKQRKVYIFDSDKFYIFQKKIHLKIFRYTLKGYNNRLETRRILRRKRGKFIQRVSSFQRDRSIRGGGGIERGRRSPWRPRHSEIRRNRDQIAYRSLHV